MFCHFDANCLFLVFVSISKQICLWRNDTWVGLLCFLFYFSSFLLPRLLFAFFSCVFLPRFLFPGGCIRLAISAVFASSERMAWALWIVSGKMQSEQINKKRRKISTLRNWHSFILSNWFPFLYFLWLYVRTNGKHGPHPPHPLLHNNNHHLHCCHPSHAERNFPLQRNWERERRKGVSSIVFWVVCTFS